MIRNRTRRSHAAFLIWIALQLLPGIGHSQEPAQSAAPQVPIDEPPPVKVEATSTPVAAPVPPPPPLLQPPPPKPRIEFAGSVQLGLNFVAGNAYLFGLFNSISMTIRRGNNAGELLSRLSYGQAGVQALGGPVERTVTSALLWWERLRYDRYFLDKNAIYIAFGTEGNFRAGIKYRLEPMAGYSRTLWQSARQTLRVELGYAFTYETYTEGVEPTEGLFHDVRFGVRYLLKLGPQLMVSNLTEAFWSLNLIERVRMNSLTSLNVNLGKRLSLNLNLKTKLNTRPPTRPPLMPAVDPELGRFELYDITLDVSLGFSW